MIGWNEDIKKHLGACGENVFIGHNVIFTQPQNVFLGDNVRIDPFTLITSKLKTGNYVQITAYAMLGGSHNTVTLGNWTFIGYGSKLFTNSEDYSGNDGPVNEYWGNNKVFSGDIEFKDYAGVASDVIVFPGITLPEGCCIGAKSLVHRNEWNTRIPFVSSVGRFQYETVREELVPYTVFAGNPLSRLKKRNKVAILEKALNDPTFKKAR